MSKFRIKMKLTGLELEIEGSRDDVPLMAQQLGRQFSGMLNPAAQIVSGDDAIEVESVQEVPQQEALPAGQKRKKSARKKSSSASAAAAGNDAEALDWRHDPSALGMPQQTWNTAKKAMWLLYAAREATDTRELSAARIAATFNKHFRQAGTILSFNVTRDLGRQKLNKPAPVGEDTKSAPSQWFLTDEGIRQAKLLASGAEGATESEEES